MKINGIKILATNQHLFTFKSNDNDRYVNKTCDELIWDSLSNQKHIIYHDRTRFDGISSKNVGVIEGIRIISEYRNENTNK